MEGQKRGLLFELWRAGCGPRARRSVKTEPWCLSYGLLDTAGGRRKEFHNRGCIFRVFFLYRLWLGGRKEGSKPCYDVLGSGLLVKARRVKTRVFYFLRYFLSDSDKGKAGGCFLFLCYYFVSVAAVGRRKGQACFSS